MDANDWVTLKKSTWVKSARTWFKLDPIWFVLCLTWLHLGQTWFKFATPNFEYICDFQFNFLYWNPQMDRIIPNSRTITARAPQLYHSATPGMNFNGNLLCQTTGAKCSPTTLQMIIRFSLFQIIMPSSPQSAFHLPLNFVSMNDHN